MSNNNNCPKNNNTTYYTNKRRRKNGRMISTFTITDKTYSIRLTAHAKQRLTDRNIDLFQVTGSILRRKNILKNILAVTETFLSWIKQIILA